MAIKWKCEKCKYKNDSLPILPVSGPGIAYVSCYSCKELNILNISYKQFCQLQGVGYEPLKPSTHNGALPKVEIETNNKISKIDIIPPAGYPLKED